MEPVGFSLYKSLYLCLWWIWHVRKPEGEGLMNGLRRLLTHSVCVLPLLCSSTYKLIDPGVKPCSILILNIDIYLVMGIL